MNKKIIGIIKKIPSLLIQITELQINILKIKKKKFFFLRLCRNT